MLPDQLSGRMACLNDNTFISATLQLAVSDQPGGAPRRVNPQGVRAAFCAVTTGQHALSEIWILGEARFTLLKCFVIGS